MGAGGVVLVYEAECTAIPSCGVLTPTAKQSHDKAAEKHTQTTGHPTVVHGVPRKEE